MGQKIEKQLNIYSNVQERTIMQRKQRIMLIRIAVTAVIFFPLLVAEHMGYMENWNILLQVCVFLIPYVLIGYDIVLKAFRNIKNGQIFDENFLMTIATVGAFGAKEFSESVAVMLFYQVGELFQSYAVGKSREAIAALMDIAPEFANLEEDGSITQVDPDDVEIGSIIVVRAGEKVPLDGVVIEGESMLDTKALTGESVPRRVRAGEDIFSGCINGSSTLRIRTTKEYDDSTVAKILELVEEAGDKKASVENFITRFARYYTPAVALGALALMILGPVISGGGVGSISVWLLRACTFLVVSCPCALVISVPMGFFGGIGAASKQGILVKGSNYLELMAQADTVVFDKTGTLTKGEFKVTDIIPENGFDRARLLEIAAHGESLSSHPIALSIVRAYETEGKSIEGSRVTKAEEISGHGIRVQVDGSTVLLGNNKLLNEQGIGVADIMTAGTVVYAAINGAYAGAIIISDEAKPEAKAAIASMKKVGIRRTVMLTGDREESAAGIAGELGIDEYHSQLLPGDKVNYMERILADSTKKARVAFVGDGINDAPVLRRADIGIAMGSMGSDAAIEAADIVLMDDDVSKIASVVRIARNTVGIVRQNIVFAISVKLLVLLLSAIGLVNMWAAVFADVGVAVIAIMNSMRALGIKNMQ